MATTPGKLIVIPPGGKEGGNPAQTWWTCWLVLQNSDFALGEEFWMRGSWSMTSDSAVPNNFCPHVNIHVSGSNPAFGGIAVSPIQYDLAAQAHTIYTHGGGVFGITNGIAQYTDVVKYTTPNAPAYAKPVLYDWVMHGINNPDPNVGFIQMWVNGHDGSSWKIADLHTSTFYNSDPGPLNLYFGFYAKGLPAENAQPNGDAATFKINAYMPRKAATYAACQAATPLVFDHARGNLTTPVFTVSDATPLDDSLFIYPAELGGGGGGGTPGGSTFGKSTIGASWNDADTPYKFANKIGPILAGKTVTLSNPRIYMQGNPAGSGSQNLKMILWADGSPIGNVLNVGSSVTISGGGGGTVAGWQTFTFEGSASTFNITNSTGVDAYVWMGVINQGAGNAAQIAFDAGPSGSNPFKTSGTEYTTIADGDPFGTPDGLDTSLFSFAVDYITTPPPPVCTVNPSISGAPTVTATLTCSTGTWTQSGTPVYTYAWTRDGATIGTGSTYVVVNGDVNHQIGCTVTNTDEFGAGVASATPIVPTGTAPTNVAVPAIDTDSPVVGNTIQVVSLGLWHDDGSPTLTEQWQHAVTSGGLYTNISGETGTSYVITSAVSGLYVRLAVTNTTPDGDATAFSNVIGPIQGAPVPPAPNTLTMTADVVGTLTLTPRV